MSLPNFGESLRLGSVGGASMANVISTDSGGGWGLSHDPSKNSEEEILLTLYFYFSFLRTF